MTNYNLLDGHPKFFWHGVELFHRIYLLWSSHNKFLDYWFGVESFEVGFQGSEIGFEFFIDC